MLRYVSYDIVFQEIPTEVTLAVTLSGCPNRCQGCHSPHLRQEIGEPLSEEAMENLLLNYGTAVTCVCFMGGDADVPAVERLALFVRQKTGGRLKTAWYSGRSKFPAQCNLQSFDYLKLGPYLPNRGGLKNPDTNQRFFCIQHGEMIDQTFLFHT